MDLAGRGRRDDKGSHGDFLRETSIVVVTLETSEFYIVVSLSTRNDTQVIYVDPTSGALSYHDKLGHDLFHSEREAVDYITDGSSFKSIYARGIIGYSALGSVGLLLVATKLTATIPNLPGGGCVYTVTESQCIQIPLHNPLPQGKGELKNIQELAEYDIDGKHYFCETRDITRAFPSSFTLLNPDDEFVWNGWLSKPFEDIGLQQHCVILLQGFAESRNFGGSGQQAWMVALIARRSRLHPGTRYLARGMNACNSTGNEVECEQLVWISQNPRQNLHFSTYVWRRGTIPMWWGAELKLTAAEAEIYVSPQDPYRGSLQYYQRLSRRYCARNADVAVVNHKKKKLVPITCVNLLRNGEGKSESVLVEHFVESLNCIRSSGKLPYAPLHLINYDWHATVKLRGEQQTIEGLWRHLKNPTLTVGFSEGSYFPSKQALQGCKGVLVPDDNFGDGFCLRSCQNGVIRFNCADSLDRTNAASFFGALQVFVEQCRRLGINLDQDAIYGFSSSNYSEPNNVGLYTGPLPPGWEERTDAVTGKIFYINHNTRTTTWEHPCPDKPWKRFNMTFEQFKSSTISYPITQLADLFLLAGDIHATLYTGSKAMHSQILNIFNTDTGKFNKFSAAQNMKITLQRRYQNVVVDSSRQKQLEMFLGIRLFKHLPSVSIHPLQVLSRPSSCLLKPVSHMFPSASGEPNLLSFKKKNVTWVCSPATDVVELFIYLEEPCHVCQLLITVAQGAEDTSTPGRFPERLDVRTGCNLDGLKLVLEGACLPQCANGTNIVIPLMGAISSEDLAITGSGARLNAEESSSSLLYDFEELEGELNFLTRVVALTFYPAVPNGTPMVLGEVEVLGVSLPWTGIFAKKGAGKNFIELVQMLPKATKGFVPGSDFRPSTNPFLYGPDTDQHSSTFVPRESVSRAEPGFDNLGLDLLTGDISFPHSTSQSELSGAAVSQSGGILDVFEESVTEDSYSAQDSNLPTMLHEESSTTNTGVQHYLDCLKYFQNKGYKLDFVEAMKLEIERLRINLSAAERDRVLLSAGIVPATLDPNLLLEDTYLATICKYANVLAFLAQSAFEDKINSSIGLENVDNEAIDFWNVDSFGDNCYGGMCEVREVEQLSFQLPTAVPSTGSSLLMPCSHCEQKACRVCCAGKGAVLLANYILKERKSMYGSSGQTGSSHGSKSEGLSVSNDGILCKSCCDDIILHVLYVDYVRVMNSLRRRVRADNAAKESLDQVLGSGVNNTCDTYQDIDTGRKQLNKLLNGEESLAEFPFASMLYSVETAVGSDPPLSLLAPLGTGTRHSYWKAPPSCSRVEFSIVLGSLSDVSGVMLLISSCGYSATDCPIVQVWASNKINREERSCMGKWDVRSLAASSSELYGPENACGKKNILRHVKFLFNNSVRCRIIWIMLTLPLAASNSVNLDRDFNLLSLDDGSFIQPYRHGSFREGAGNSPCIHAKRLIVLGRAITKDPSLQGSDRVNVRSWSERSSPPLSRFKVPVEAERLSGNDLILEQYLLPSAPGIAGFRVDVLNVIKPRITHSPAASDSDIWQSSLTCLEDRHISPAVLYIHVSIVQESRKRVTLGTYRLPEARVGTPLYFDFSRPIQCRVITFKLLGDIAAFADDPAEQGEFDIKASALASGLSLSNRIKLYYYGNPYELGKLAALNAV